MNEAHLKSSRQPEAVGDGGGGGGVTQPGQKPKAAI